MDNNEVIKHLEEKKESLQSDFQSKIFAIDKTIQTLKELNGNVPMSGEYITKTSAANSIIPEKYLDFDTGTSLKNKIVAIIKTENRFLHVREIAKALHGLEPEIKEVDYVKKISPALSTAKRAPGSNVTSVTIGTSNTNTFWGAKNWIDENGQIETEHMYNETELTGNNGPITI